jgi:hypothetical protein
VGRGRSFTSPPAVAVVVLDVVLATAVPDLLVFAASICCADTVCWKECHRHYRLNKFTNENNV